MAILSNKSLFQYPRTPAGKASLLDLATESTHRIVGDHTGILFEADPDVVREYVPEPLELDGSGRVFLKNFGGWVYTDRQSTEFVSEERINYTESFFWIPCTHKGEIYYYMPFSWVNRDWLAYLGRAAGMPHKIADVQVTQFHPSDPVYNGPREGVRICISVNNVGLVLRAYVDLKRPIRGEELPFRIGHGECPKYVGHRYVYDVVEDKPALNDLVVHWGDDLELDDVWAGEAGVTFYDAENEEVLSFQPKRVVGGWWYRQIFNHGTSRSQVLHRF